VHALRLGAHPREVGGVDVCLACQPHQLLEAVDNLRQSPGAPCQWSLTWTDVTNTLRALVLSVRTYPEHLHDLAARAAESADGIAGLPIHGLITNSIRRQRLAAVAKATST
jgi:hypothetical protein